MRTSSESSHPTCSAVLTWLTFYGFRRFRLRWGHYMVTTTEPHNLIADESPAFRQRHFIHVHLSRPRTLTMAVCRQWRRISIKSMCLDLFWTLISAPEMTSSQTPKLPLYVNCRRFVCIGYRKTTEAVVTCSTYLARVNPRISPALSGTSC